MVMMMKISLITAFGIIFAASLTAALDKADEEAIKNTNHIEGDMILSEEQYDNLFFQMRNGLTNEKYYWPNGIVPIAMNSNHTTEQQEYIERAIKKIESVSCIKFIPRTIEDNFIQLTTWSGCYSQIGYQRGKQVVNLQPSPVGTGCFLIGSIIHEFLHALGFYHMHSAYDRDNYVTVHSEYWPENQRSNFRKYENAQVSHFGETYDYNSIMHYGKLPKDRKPTIVPKDERYLNIIGQRIGMSKKDILKLNKMYRCDTSRLVMPSETDFIERLVDISGGKPEKNAEKEPESKKGTVNKATLIEQARNHLQSGLLSGIIEKELENKDMPELFDLVIKGLKVNLEQRPKFAALIQQQIDYFEKEKNLFKSA